MATEYKTSYKVQVNCTNCGFSGTKEIKYGAAVAHTPCSNCGCACLELQHDQNVTWKWSTTVDEKLVKVGDFLDRVGKDLDDLFKK